MSGPAATRGIIGSNLAHYVVLERLGAGGMGEVYRARDEALDREVAIKVLPEEFSRDPTRVARFQREARLASRLSHANIATVFEAGEENHRQFISMELVEGETLCAKMRAGGLSLHRILDIAIPLAEGLGEAHETGVVHRDLKPANVMVDTRGRVKILDFGLSRRLPEAGLETAVLTVPGTVLGTPHYMAPEQMLGEEADARSDLFSLGVILYELATGTRPFDARSLAEVMQSVLGRTPPPLLASNPLAGEPYACIVDRLLAKDPAARFQSAGEVVAALESLRRPSTTTMNAARDEPRAPPPRLAAAVLGMAVLVVAGVERGSSEPRRGLAPVDTVGAAVFLGDSAPAAIQGPNAALEEQLAREDAQLAENRARIEELEAQLDELMRRLGRPVAGR